MFKKKRKEKKKKNLISTLNLLHPNIFQGTELINPTIYH